MKFLLFLFAFAQLFSAMEYFPGKGKEGVLGKEGSIQLLTWNILGLRNDMSMIRPWEERIDGIAELILSSGADVVILQECFEQGLSLGLYERLKGAFAHIYLHVGEEKTPMSSGLALFSKLPVKEFRFTPHPDLLDGERRFHMGTLDFLLLNAEKKPIAHIAGSHFQGSSNCEWRVGLTEDGKRLSYPEVREQEAEAAFKLLAEPKGVPSYLCGDLNVDRRSTEFQTSKLNSQINPHVQDNMPPDLQMAGTNTNFWKHKVGLGRMFSSLSSDEVLSLALIYKKFYEEKLIGHLNKDPLRKPIAEFKATFLSELKNELKLTPDEEKLWKYFHLATTMAIAKERQLWKENKNPEDAPPVAIGRVIENNVMPIEESLDYILGTSPEAMVNDVKLLQGYENHSLAKTLSDHHALKAQLKVAEARAY